MWPGQGYVLENIGGKTMNSLDIAIKMETDAVDFYESCAAKVGHPVGRKMFLTIAADEKRHISYVNQLIEGMDFRPEDITPMQNIRTVFAQNREAMEQKLAVTANELEAFSIALKMESEGFNFYEKAAGLAGSAKEKDLFERLAQEEREHYRMFDNTLTYLKDSGLWFMWEERAIYEGG
jgi:rubrerythrin